MYVTADAATESVGIVGRFFGKFKRPVVESAGVGVVAAAPARSSTSSQRDESWLGDRDLAYLDGSATAPSSKPVNGHGRVASADDALFDGFADAPTSLAPTKSTTRWRFPGRAALPVDARPVPQPDALGDLFDAFGDAPSASAGPVMQAQPLPRSSSSFDPLDPLAAPARPVATLKPAGTPAPLLPRPPPSPTFGDNDDAFGAFASFNAAPVAPPPLLPPPSGRSVARTPPPLPQPGAAPAPAAVAGSGLSRADLSFFDSL